MSSRTHVNVDNFVTAETDRMFAALQRDCGGVNTFLHNREPADVEHQTVVRLNRDTLYSFAIVDLADGATLTLPDAGERYLSAMIVNGDHFVTAIFHDAGTYELTQDALGTRYVLVAVRILVDPQDAADVAAVAALQDQVGLTAASGIQFRSPAYDEKSLDATRRALLDLASGMQDFTSSFGRRDQVDPVRHLIGTAAGWGGLPTDEAIYVGVNPSLPLGAYTLTVRDVPVDGFWSLSVYDAEGFFVPNVLGAYAVNSVTATKDASGAVVIHLGEWEPGTPNHVPVPEGWNYLVRLYRPRDEIRDGSWTFPAIDA